MSLVSALKNLLIPVKSSAQTVDLDTDWRAIEIWSQQIVAAIKSITPGGFYASLTGPGETITPGALTQQGDFTIDNGDLTEAGNVIVQNPSTPSDTLTIDSSITTSGQATFTFHNQELTLASNVLMVINTHDALYADNATSTFQGATGVNVFATTGTADLSGPAAEVFGDNTVLIDCGATGSVSICHSPGHSVSQLSFFGVTPVNQQSSAGITTVAQLVTVLQNYGLLS